MTRPAWGNPWRGMIQSGEIQLPGGSVKSAAQPSGVHDRHYDEQGATFLQRGPQAGVTRTEPELAADAAAGRTWRADAILSGQRMDLYGQTLGGWIYCAPDGGRWLVPAEDLEISLETDQPLSVSLTLRRFGDFGQPAVEHIVSLELADLGQAEPDPAYPAGASGYLTVCDITPDGARALLMLYQPVVPFSSSSGWHPLHKRPLGWLELTLSGSGAEIEASVAVARTRAQAFGSGVWSGVSSTAVSKFEQADSLSRVDMGTYYQDTYTPMPLAATGSSGWTWYENAGSYEYSFAGRILALWYTAEGELEEVTLDVSTTGTVSNPSPTEVVSGTQVQHVFKDDSPTVVVSDDRQHTLSRTATVTEAFTVTLKRGGVLVDQSTGSASINLNQTRRFIWLSGLPFFSARSDSVTIDGVTASNSASGESGGPALALGTVSPSWFAALQPGNSAAQAAFRATDMLLLFPGGSLTIDPLRYSNKLMALRRYRAAAGVETYRHGPAAFPGGADSGTASVAALAVFGSYNPATGEVVRDQTQSVCWI